MAAKFLTVLLVPDGDASPSRYRMPLWLFRTILITIVVILLAPVAYVAIYFDMVDRAVQATSLRTVNDSLSQMLESRQSKLAETRYVLTKIMDITGLDPELLAQLYSDDAQPVQPVVHERVGMIGRTSDPTSPIPEGLPTTGWISRGYSDVEGKKHGGLDIAVPEGTDVYSTAFGTVVSAGIDSVFGETVIVQNGDSIETVYGHNSKLMVQAGDTIFAGQRIALSGNTGRSSAPHLHYEIRINGKPVNPLTFYSDEIKTQ